MTYPELLDEFLRTYATALGWREAADIDALEERLCKQGHFATLDAPNGTTGREFQLMAFGWAWGYSKDHNLACEVFNLVNTRLMAAYRRVHPSGKEF